MKNKKRRRYTPEMLAFLRDNAKGRTMAELTTFFNDAFGESATSVQIRGVCERHKIRSGRPSGPKKGYVPWNKGKTGLTYHSRKPLWSERVDKRGYISMSVPERNPYTGSLSRYKHKHLWIWEQAHGPRPKGSVVIFKDGDSRNFDLDNLLLVTQAELFKLNSHGYKDLPAELKPATLALAKLEAKAGFWTEHPRGRKKDGDRGGS